MTHALPRRNRHRAVPVEITEFIPHIDQAMQAFGNDVSYAVLMARAAVTIVRKREVWQARRDARAAGA